jgi:agmatinase
MDQTTIEKLKWLEQGLPSESSELGLFGVDIPEEDAAIVLLPVPWEETASYRKGTANAWQSILSASHQLDLFDLDFGKPFWAGITMLEAIDVPVPDEADTDSINLAGEIINSKVYEISQKFLTQNKFVGVIGGEHSVPFGLIKALSERYKDISILHIDAHHDLRDAYEGFTNSHASIMRNVATKISNPPKIVSVAVRDFSQEEYEFASQNSKRIKTFYDRDIFEKKAKNTPFSQITAAIISNLSDHVYISFDIDGLEQYLCPKTGTPVPGGLEFNEATYILTQLAKSGKKIIGFDLCESAEGDEDDEWDSNVAARILYKLCGACGYSNGLYEKF